MDSSSASARAPRIRRAAEQRPNRLELDRLRPAALRRIPRRTLAVASGKGGVGKSNIAANLAIALAQRGKQVLLVDGDLGLANVDLLLGLSPRTTLKDVVQGRLALEDVVLDGPLGLRVLPASSGVEELANLDDFRREKLVRSIQELDEQLDFVLVDTGSGIGRNVTSLALAADEVMVVTTPEPPSFSDAYALIKVLARRPLQAPPRLVVNMVSGYDEWQEVAARIALVSRRFLGLELTQWGYVYDDPAVGHAVQKQEAFVQAAPYCLASKCIQQLAGRLLEDPGFESAGLEGFLRRVEPEPAEGVELELEGEAG
ncbi:MAG TPA: MinD/ParA family protein [Candidatus Saccharimonadales bacterium]|nr:MinD/ParA family protein [Candidatus Saccharimonadales bacterium]